MKKLIILCSVFLLAFSSFTYAGGWFTGASEWALNELDNAKENGIITYDDFVDEIGGYSNNITREQFSELIMRMYYQMMEKYPEPASFDTFDDTDNTFVFMAKELGIINGKGGKTFAPNDFITRQEMAVMMTRALDSMEVKYNKGDGIITVEDKSEVASWAAKGVDFAFDNGFMRGDGVKFKPLANTPIEQAVIIVNRVFEEYKDDIVKEAEIEPNDYTKGYNLSISDGELYAKFKNNDQSVKVAIGVLTADYTDNEISEIFYLKKTGHMYRYDFRNATHTWLKDTYNLTDFTLVEDGKYEGYIIGKYVYDGKTKYKVFKNNYDGTYEGDVSSMRDPNYQIGEMYDEIETKKYQFGMVVTDPSQNFDNVKFTEDNMYFYSSASHYDYVDNKKGYLRLSPYAGSEDNAYVGPLGRAGGKDAQWTFNGYGGIYETDITFNNEKGNAGIVFNLKWAGDGNDNYAGYYAGIDVENNKVILGKAAYGNWTNMKSVELGYNISNGDTATLKVMKNGNDITVYVDGRAYITKTDDTFTKDGGFGIRTWKTDATYSDYTINPLPY